ncbi:MAG: hypothetical protein HY535_01375 [Chloroflexi bacterium]|nr:hypothetical protein [Chloroflexota bacterium]
MHRAEEVFPELQGQLRWEFVARVKGRPDWRALEVKALLIPEDRRQINDWSAFCTRVTRQLQGKLQGEFAITTSIPWTFDQADGRRLVRAFVEALFETVQNQASESETNLGPAIAARFQGWPTKPPTNDQNLWREQGIWRVICPPEDLLVVKLEDSGCSVEIGASEGQAFVVDSALERALLGIFDARGGRGAKPNEQMREAHRKGASETVLLLDSHIRWKPNVVAQVLKSIDQTLLSNIDAVYLVDVANGRAKRV